MLGSRIIIGKRVEMRPISAFKPNTPTLYISTYHKLTRIYQKPTVLIHTRWQLTKC